MTCGFAPQAACPQFNLKGAIVLIKKLAVLSISVSIVS
jgi:hypothetical protein